MSDKEKDSADAPVSDKDISPEKKPASGGTKEEVVEEIGGRDGLDPTRYGDWEINGRCVDF